MTTTEPPPGPPAQPGLSPLVAEVLRLANRVHSVTRQTGHSALQQRIEAEAGSWKDSEVRIVVAGEIKRGKTSFINSLLGQPGLLPVDADVATSVHLAVSYADTPHVTVVRRPSEGETEERISIRPDQLVDYASMQGDAVRREGVVGVEVGLPHPLLERGLVLIDTPGVGGLTRGHRDSALAALGFADALLFTVSVEEPVGRSELQFLAEASERIDTVVMILTKVDSSAEPERMLAEDRAKMADYVAVLERRAADPDADEDEREAVRRFQRVLHAPFLPVSSRLADKARARAEAGREDAAETLHARSGLSAIEAVFDRTLANRELVRMANILRLIGHVLARIESEQVAAVRVADGDSSEVEAELLARQGELAALLTSQARWRQSLAGSVARIQADLNRIIGREMTRLDRTYREHIDQNQKDAERIMASLGTDLEQSINASWTSLGQALAERLDAAVAKLTTEFALDDLVFELDRDVLPEYLRDLGMADRRDPNVGKSSLLDDGLPLFFTASAFRGLAGIFLGGAASAALLPGLVLAAPIGYLRYKKRQRAQVRQDYLRIVREVIAQVRQEFAAEFVLKIIEARQAVETSVDLAITARKKAVDGQRKELQGLIKQSKADQQARRSRAEANLKGIRQLRSEANELRAKVDAALGLSV